MMRILPVLLACVAAANAFHTPPPLYGLSSRGLAGVRPPHAHRIRAPVVMPRMGLPETLPNLPKLPGPLAGLSMTPVNEWFLKAFASPVLRTKAVALVHPVVMLALYGVCIYTAWLGLHWRSVRTMPAGDERSRKLKAAVASKDKHYKIGSFLLGGSIFFAIEGCVNTWCRTGRLFATPHLFAGAGVAALFSLSAATVPYMERQTWGAAPARWIHMILNFGIVGLFTWQVITGWGILQNVWKLVPWQVVV